jgi:hypothetical protein
MSRFRMTDKFRAEWARILAFGEHAETERAKLERKGVEGTEANRMRAIYVVASVITARWRAAGFTSATIEDDTVRPERPHATTWKKDGAGYCCSVCGRWQWRSPPPNLCDGADPFTLVHRAVARGVPFGLQDGLPTAGVPLEPGNVVEKPARATCRPRRQEECAAA